MECRKEIAPANQIPNSQTIKVHGRENIKRGMGKLGGGGSGNSHFSDLEAFPLHVWSQVAFELHLDAQLSENGVQMNPKLIPNGSQTI